MTSFFARTLARRRTCLFPRPLMCVQTNMCGVWPKVRAKMERPASILVAPNPSSISRQPSRYLRLIFKRPRKKSDISWIQRNRSCAQLDLRISRERLCPAWIQCSRYCGWSGTFDLCDGNNDTGFVRSFHETIRFANFRNTTPHDSIRSCHAGSR